MSGSTHVEDIADALRPIVAGAGLRLYDVDITGAGRARVLQVLVDREGGVDLEVLGAATAAVSAALDEEPLESIVGVGYSLEVSSPGLERPLRRPEHYAGAVGETVSVKRRDATGAVIRDRGVLLAATDEAIELETDHAVERIALADVLAARTVFVWGPTEKPGKRPAKQRKPMDGKREVAAR